MGSLGQPPSRRVPNPYPGADGDDPPRWRIAEIIGAVASLIAVVAAIMVGVKHLPYFELRREEGLASSLLPGDDYGKMVAILGAQPDFSETLSSGQLYVFNRPWEYIQLLVDHTGTVISVGVYAKTTEFKATLLGGVTVNGPAAQQVNAIVPLEAFGECDVPVGLSSYYFEGGTINVETGIAAVVGDTSVTDTNDPMAIDAPCSYISSCPRPGLTGRF